MCPWSIPFTTGVSLLSRTGRSRTKTGRNFWEEWMKTRLWTCRQTEYWIIIIILNTEIQQTAWHWAMWRVWIELFGWQEVNAFLFFGCCARHLEIEQHNSLDLRDFDLPWWPILVLLLWPFVSGSEESRCDLEIEQHNSLDLRDFDLLWWPILVSFCDFC